VTKSTHGQLEIVADSLWTPLFEDSENSEETTRNVAAACLGKLTTTHASRYLPQLHVGPFHLLFVLPSSSIRQARIRDADPKNRATVVSAIRYTFSDSDTSYDALLAPLIVDFLSIIVDTDLVSDDSM
jgi:cullin-associated NEDD8-dissociated protein 1